MEVILSKVIEEIKQELDKRWKNHFASKDQSEYNAGAMDAITSLKEYLDSAFLKDFKTGAIRTYKTETLKYRGFNLSFLVEYFKGGSVGFDYTTTELDDDMMWRVFREWCGIKKFETFREISPEVEGTIWGYIARDRDGQLWFFQDKPKRKKRQGIWYTDCECIAIPRDRFSKITWETEPKEIKLLMVDEDAGDQ